MGDARDSNSASQSLCRMHAGVVYENEDCTGLSAHSGPWVAFAEYLDNVCVLHLW